MKRFVLAAVLIVLVIGVAIVAGGSFVAKAIERKANAELAALGVPGHVRNARVGRGIVSLGEICLRAGNEPAAPELGCLKHVTFEIPIRSAIHGKLDIRSVEVREGNLDLSIPGAAAQLREIAERLGRRSVGDDDGSGSSGGPAEPPRGVVPSIAVGRFDLALGNDQPLSGVQVRDFWLGPADEAFATLTATLAPSYGANLVAVAGNGLPAVVGVQGEYTNPDQWHVDLVGDQGRPLAFSVGTGDDRTAVRWAGAGVRDGRTLTVRDLDVQPRGGAFGTFTASAVELEIREPTTELADLYLARASLVDPHLHLEVGEGTFVETVANLFGGQAAGPTGGPGEPADGSGEPAVPDERVDPWAGRRWWERIPQRIDIDNGVVSANFVFLTDPVFAADARIENINVEYALRAIRTQLDVSASADLVMSGRSAGRAELSAIWDWADATLELDANATDIEIGLWNPLTASTRAAMPRGHAAFDLRFRELADGSIPEFGGSVSADFVDIDLDVLRDPLRLEHLDWSWEATREPEQTSLVFHEGGGRLGGAEFSFRPTIHGFDYENPLLGDRIDVRFAVPEQDAMVVLASIPPTLLGPVAGAQMTGTWGMDIDFPLTWGPPSSETGRPTLDVGEPSSFAVHDQSLHLEFLPPEVDVRRLNDAMEFTFAGPDPMQSRVLAIPPPTRPASGLDLDAPAEPPAGWTRLEDISYFLVAATLYREDGRFFRNRGINWFQWRSVIEQAWSDQRLGRGASTVSMQLVKNVFLTHERTLERKLQELFLTYWMTRLVPKDRMLEIYLNVIEWGPGINGVTEASEYYFGKTPSELTVAEAVWLSSIIPAPVRRGQQRARGVASDWSIRHCHDLMRGMADRGWITRGELAKGLSGTVRFVTATGPAPARPAPGVDALGNLLEEATEIANEGAPPVSPDGVRLDRPPRQRLLDLIATQLELRP